MSEQNSETITILDQMISQDNIQIMKAALPYLPSSGQRSLSIFAKMMELQNTISLFSNPQSDMSICAVEDEASDPMDMLKNIRSVCKKPMQEKIDTIINTFVMIELFKISQDSTDL